MPFLNTSRNCRKGFKKRISGLIWQKMFFKKLLTLSVYFRAGPLYIPISFSIAILQNYDETFFAEQNSSSEKQFCLCVMVDQEGAEMQFQLGELYFARHPMWVAYERESGFYFAKNGNKSQTYRYADRWALLLVILNDPHLLPRLVSWAYLISP